MYLLNNFNHQIYYSNFPIILKVNISYQSNLPVLFKVIEKGILQKSIFYPVVFKKYLYLNFTYSRKGEISIDADSGPVRFVF